MSEREIKNERLKEVEELHYDVYALFCTLTRYKDKLTEQTFRYMADRLYWLYREEFERMFAPYAIEREQEKYKQKKRRKKFVPRETWFLHRKNLSAKYFIDGVTVEADGFFDAFKKKLAERKRNRPVRLFFRRIFKRGKRAPATLPPTGVNDLSELAAPLNVANLPTATAETAPQPPHKTRKREADSADHNSDEPHKTPKTGKEHK